jgi:hypothetical protein
VVAFTPVLPVYYRSIALPEPPTDRFNNAVLRVLSRLTVGFRYATAYDSGAYGPVPPGAVVVVSFIRFASTTRARYVPVLLLRTVIVSPPQFLRYGLYHGFRHAWAVHCWDGTP